MNQIICNEEKKLSKFEFLNIENLDLKYMKNKEFIKDKIYPKVSNMIYTYLNESDNETKELKFKVEIPKDLLPSLLDGTAEFMKDSEGKTLPCIRSSENKKIIRQIRLKILKADESEKNFERKLDNFNNMAFYNVMGKAMEELKEIKNLIKETNKTLKEAMYDGIEAGIMQYLQAQEDRREDDKRIALLNARQTLSNSIVKLSKEINENKRYFEDAKKTNYIVRELFIKKYSFNKLEDKCREFDRNIKYLYDGICCWLKINLELGNSNILSNNFFKDIQQNIMEIQSENLQILMPENAEREEIYYNIVNINKLFILEDEKSEKVVIDVLLKEGE